MPLGHAAGKCRWENAVGTCSWDMQLENVVGKMPLGKCRWENAVGKMPLRHAVGTRRWENAIGKMPLGKCHWENAVKTCSWDMPCYAAFLVTFVCNSQVFQVK